MQENTTVLEHKISSVQDQYYETHSKAMFFKQNQKMECAAAVSQNISLDELFQKTIIAIPSTNSIYFDYLIFKTYANTLIYDQMVDYIMKLFDQVIRDYGSFQLHINLQSFTMTAAQRYKDIARIFCGRCLAKDSSYSRHVVGLHIYHCPRMIDSLSNLFSTFVDENVRAKVVLHQGGFQIMSP
jgi:hypothetical protein